MKISQHKVVVLTYALEVEGNIVDRADENQPLDYIQGCHMLIPKFEDEVEGKEAGDSFAFSLSPEEGYGEYDPAKRFDIPKDTFVVNGQLREDLLVIGRVIPMLNSAGEVCPAQIIEVKENDVTVDFNHSMAGKTLNFSGKILSVREATEKELSEGLHGEFLPVEGGCCGHHGKGGCCHGHHGDGEGCHCHEDDGDGCHCHEGHEEDGSCCHGHHGEGEGCHCHHEE